MDLSKSQDFFNPIALHERIHIIGCGSVGSTVAELLARLGVTKLTLYDFDKVEAKNIANQMFVAQDIHSYKIDAVKRMIQAINPEVTDDDIKLEYEGYTGQRMSGYVFLAVDNIETRRKIIENIKSSFYIKAVFDFRTGLTDAQHFAADWSIKRHRTDLMKSMDFTHEEAKSATPVSACGIELSVAATIRIVVSFGVTNFMNFTMGKPLKKFIQADAFDYIVDAF